jgi:hypothetical protein
LEDRRSFHGADSFSDHQIVIAHFKLKLKTIVKYKRTLRTFDLQKLMDKYIKQNYCLSLSNKLFSLVCKERTTSVGEIWTQVVENVESVDEETLGFDEKKGEQ